MKTLLIQRSELAQILHAFRCQGCELQVNKNTYKIVPIIGPLGWDTQEQYKQFCKKYLEPLRGELTAALRIEEKAPTDLPPGVEAVPSPWPDLTGRFIYVVESEDARRSFQGTGIAGWTFVSKELAAMKRERDPVMALRWRGEHGCYLGHEKQYEQNRGEWFSVGQAPETKEAGTP